MAIPLFPGKQDSENVAGGGGGGNILALLPLLFIIYMKLLGEVVRGFESQCHQHADDTQLYCTLSPDLKEAIDTLSQCLEMV